MDSMWGKVTWYSKLLALIVFGAMPFIGFYLGVLYGNVRNEYTKLELQVKQNRDSSPRYQEAPLNVPSTVVPATPTEILDTSTWKTYRNEEFGFEVMYPLDWSFEFHAGSKNMSLSSPTRSHLSICLEDEPCTGFGLDPDAEIVDGYISIGGLPGRRTDFLFDGELFRVLAGYEPKQSKYPTFFVHFQARGNVVEENRIFTKILSTFKFTK